MYINDSQKHNKGYHTNNHRRYRRRRKKHLSPAIYIPIIILLSLIIGASISGIVFYMQSLRDDTSQAPSTSDMAERIAEDSPDEDMAAASSEEAVPEKEAAPQMDVYFINTERSVCILCTDGEYSIMLDSGDSNDNPDSIAAIKAQLKDLGIDTIDALLLSHGHGDHTGGAQILLNDLIADPDAAIAIKRLIYDFGDPGVPSAYNVENLAAELTENRGMDIEIIRPETGYSLELGDMVIKCLLENEEEDVAATDEHEDELKVDMQSIISKVSLKDTDQAVLFTGDALAELELRAVERGLDLSCSMLQISHHGMADASTSEFLKATGAAYGVACTEGWDLDPQLSDRCKDAGMDFLTTMEGSIHFQCSPEATTLVQ